MAANPGPTGSTPPEPKPVAPTSWIDLGKSKAGIADKAPLWSRLAKSELLYREFILRNIDIEPFKEPWDHIELVASSRLVAWGRSATPKTTVVYDTSAVGETLFPNLSTMSRSRADAQRDLPIVVARLLAYPVAAVATAAIDQAKTHYPGHEDIPALQDQVEKGSANNAVKILLSASAAFSAQEPRYAEFLLMHTVLALVHKGTISDDFVTKFKQGLANFQLDIVIDKALVKNIFDAFNRAIDADIVRGMAEYWLSICPPECLRVSLTIIQCQWKGLALYKATVDAMTLNPDFYWGSVFRIARYRTDFAKFGTAHQVINGNPYYGFNNNLGVVASTNYKALGTACILVLKRLNQVTTYDKYAGSMSSLPSGAYIKFLINQYIKVQTDSLDKTEITEDEKKSLIAVSNGFLSKDFSAVVCPEKFDAKMTQFDD